MNEVLILLWFLSIAIAGVVAWFLRPRRDALFRGRISDLSWWENLYSPSEMPTVMATLQTLRDAFLLRECDIYRLQPADRLIDLYRAIYPHGGADSMEFEELSLLLARGHGVLESEMTHLDKLTVSDVIGLCLSHAASAG